MLKRTLAEFLGTMLLLVAIVGSGIMAEDLSGGITGLAHLANAITIGAMLYVLLTVFGTVSGAHFNPLVSAAMALSVRLQARDAVLYAVAQVLGAILGVWLAHIMFNQPVFQLSEKLRWGMGQWVAEAVATFGLLLTLFGALRGNPDNLPAVVSLYVAAAYWFTSSASMANPAITIARSLTSSFAGIAPSSIALLIIAQLIGAILAMLVLNFLFTEEPD